MTMKLSISTIKSLPKFDKPTEIYDSEIKGFFLRIQRSGVKTFYFFYRNQTNKKQRYRIGTLGQGITVAQARDKALIIAGKVAEGIDVQSDKINNRQDAVDLAKNTLASFLDEKYAPWALATYVSGKETVDAVRRFPKLLNLPLTSISVNHLEEWRIEALGRGLKRTTINRMTSAFRGVITKAVAWKFIKEHPLKDFKNLKTDSNVNIRFLSVEEDARLFHALEMREQEKRESRSRGNQHRIARHHNSRPELSSDQFVDRLYPIITVAVKTGLRRGELFDIEWRDVNFTLKQITVRGEITKNGITRHIPLSKTALETLMKWKRQCQNVTGYARVFPSDGGGRLNDIKKSYANLMKLAEIQDFRFHDLRHDFASQLVMKGVPLNTVRELMGHEDIETTLRYAHLAPNHKSEAVELLG